MNLNKTKIMRLSEVEVKVDNEIIELNVYILAIT